jgi:hypothetical protein
MFSQVSLQVFMEMNDEEDYQNILMIHNFFTPNESELNFF